MTEKLDIHDLVRSINEGDKSFYNGLSDDLKKSFVPVVVIRWLSGTPDKNKLLFLNQLLNPVIFNLHTHPDLMYKLMIIASGGNKDYRWVPKKYPKRASSESEKLIAERFDCSYKTAALYLKNMSKDDVLEIAADLGKDSDTIKKIKADFKNK